MATRTVRLDEESERALADVRRATGTSVSGALKRGLVAARDALRGESSVTPFDVYRAIDLGPVCTRARAAGEAGGARASTPQALPVILVDTTTVFTLDRGDFAAYRARIGRTSKRFTVVG